MLLMLKCYKKNGNQNKEAVFFEHMPLILLPDLNPFWKMFQWI
ncbi:unnamed protein product [Schistosoma curassoni]|uniref:Uncharacterized protein n=1 Tax=Schistosoma curassoni TaxID=6186 RepID=A0A183KBC8_9TREM|nr:unnamed protein product [Schistosoma curassoni]